MLQRALFTTILLLAVGRPALAQTVSTLATGFKGYGLLVEPNGDVLVSDYLGSSDAPDRPRGSVVRRITADGRSTTLVRGLTAPSGMARSSDGVLYIATAAGTQSDTGIIMRRASDGSVRRFADGMKALEALLALPSGDLLAASPTAGVIYRISRDGTVSVFAQDRVLAGVTGLALMGPTVLASTFSTGQIFRVSETGAPQLVARVGSPASLQTLNHITARDGTVWANIGSQTVSRGAGHRVVRVSMDGAVTTIAGNGEGGSRDGPASESRFLHNTGIGVSPDGTRLYVADWNGVRAITLP